MCLGETKDTPQVPCLLPYPQELEFLWEGLATLHLPLQFSLNGNQEPHFRLRCSSMAESRCSMSKALGSNPEPHTCKNVTTLHENSVRAFGGTIE
jgi:hypothetical protein